MAVVGHSGSGKSTLLNLVTAIDDPTKGQVLIHGTDPAALPSSKRSVWRGRNIGVVFQFFQLLPTLTVIENVMLPMDLCGVYDPAERRDRARSLLAQLGIADQAQKFPGTLSGGQQQRAAIARALANDPPLICADEPTGNLDSATSEAVLGIFQDLHRQGKTLVIITHEADISRHAQREIRIQDGSIVADTGGAR